MAFLENMVRRQGVGFNDDFKIMVIEIAADLKFTTITTDDLDDGWREFRDYSKCQPTGDEWYDAAKTAVLKVPSADFLKLTILLLTPLIPITKKFGL